MSKKLIEAIIDSCMLVSEGLVDDAERNLRNSGMFDEDSDYDGMLGKAVMELIQVFAKQGHSGASAMRTLELFDQVARRKPLTAQAWDAEREHLLQWLQDQGQLFGEHAMSNEMVQDFLDTSIGERPMVESLIEKVLGGATASDTLDNLDEAVPPKQFEVGNKVTVRFTPGHTRQGKIKKIREFGAGTDYVISLAPTASLSKRTIIAYWSSRDKVMVPTPHGN
jgi:hypothetical protein